MEVKNRRHCDPFNKCQRKWEKDPSPIYAIHMYLELTFGLEFQTARLIYTIAKETSTQRVNIFLNVTSYTGEVMCTTSWSCINRMYTTGRLHQCSIYCFLYLVHVLATWILSMHYRYVLISNNNNISQHLLQVPHYSSKLF